MSREFLHVARELQDENGLFGSWVFQARRGIVGAEQKGIDDVAARERRGASRVSDQRVGAAETALRPAGLGAARIDVERPITPLHRGA